MACRLYYEHNGQHWPLGSFPNKERAEDFWNLISPKLHDTFGAVKPVYVHTVKPVKKETRKGRR